MLVGDVLVERHGHDVELLGDPAHARGFDAAAVRQGDRGHEDSVSTERSAPALVRFDPRHHLTLPPPRILLDKVYAVHQGCCCECTPYTKAGLASGDPRRRR